VGDPKIPEIVKKKLFKVFVKYVEIKCQLDATEVFIASGLQDAGKPASCKPDA